MIQAYRCSNEHETERLFLPKVNPTRKPLTIVCPTCGLRAVRTQGRIGFAKQTYGRKYGFATDSDRRDWLNKPSIDGWVGKEGEPTKKPKVRIPPPAKRKLKVAHRGD